MATGKRYYWIKLKESFMTSDTVDFMMSQKDGANYVVLYQMLCLKTINTGGRLSRTIGEIVIPYDVEKIQRDCKWFSADTIRVALDLYKRFGLIYEEQDGTLILSDHESLVGTETSWKEQKSAQREKNLPKLNECKRLNSSMMMLPSGKTQFVDEKRYGGNGMKAFDLAGGKCEICGSDDDLCIHHANGFSNDQTDLYILCRTCHGVAHSTNEPDGWLHHTWTKQDGGGGHVHPTVHPTVHPDIRYKDTRERDLTVVVEGGQVDEDLKRAYAIYRQQIGEIPNGRASELFDSYLTDIGADAMIEAIYHVNEQQPDNPWLYLKKVLDAFAESGVHDADSAKANINDHVRRVNGRRKRNSDVPDKNHYDYRPQPQGNPFADVDMGFIDGKDD